MPYRKHGKEESPENAETKNRGRFRLRRVIGALFLFLIFVLSIAVLLHRSLLRAYAPGILSSLAIECREYYDLEITWNGYRIDRLSDFTITGITITDIPSGIPLLATDALRIQTSLPAILIRGKNPLKAVTSVRLDNPLVTLGREEDKWNVGSLLEPGGEEQWQFPGRLSILIGNGTIEWLGGEVSDRYPLQSSRITALDGIFRLGVNGGMGLDLEGLLSSNDLETSELSITGSYDADEFLIHINVTAGSLDLGLLAEIADMRGIHNLDGFADDFKASILIGPDAGSNGLSILGQCILRESRTNLDLYELSIEELSGDLYFSEESVFSPRLLGIIDGAATQVSGRYTDFTAVRKTTDLVIEASDIQPSTIGRIVDGFDAMPVTGLFNARAEVSTSVEKGVEVVVSGNSSDMSIFMYRTEMPEFFGWYTDKKFVLNRATFDMYGGVAVADGILDVSGNNSAYEYNVSLENIPVQKTAPFLENVLPSGMMPAGLLSGDIVVSRQGDAGTRYSGVIQSSGILIPGIPELADIVVTLPFEFIGGEFGILGATLSASGINVLGEGVYRVGDRFDGSVALTVDDRDLMEGIFGLPLEGEFAVAGDIGYHPGANLNFSGEAYLTDGRIGNVPVPNLWSRVAFDGDEIRISELGGLVGGGTIDGELIIPLSPGNSGREAGSIAITGLDIGSMVPDRLSSVISTSIEIIGDIDYMAAGDKLIFDMTLVEQSGRVGSNAISTGGDGISVVVDYPLGEAGNVSVLVSGTVESHPASAPVYQGRVLNEFSERIVRGVTDLLSGRTREEIQGDSVAIPSVTCTIDINANLVDIFEDTRGSIDLNARDIASGSFELGSVDFSLESENSADWSVDILADANEAGIFEVTGTVHRGTNLSESAIDLTTAVSRSELASLFEAVGLPGYERSSGTINGSGTIGGTIGIPVIEEFILNVGESEAFGIELEQGSATFSLTPPTLNLDSLDLEGSTGFRALGAGTIDLDSPSLTTASMVLRIDEFDLQVISRALERDFPVAGKLSAIIQLAQDALGLKMLYDADIDDLAVMVSGGFLPLGNLSFKAESRPGTNQLEIMKLDLTRDDELISISGMAPANIDLSDTNLFDLTIDSETGYSFPVPGSFSESGLDWSGGLGPTHLTLTGSFLNSDLSGEIGLDIRDVSYFGEVGAEALSGMLEVENSIITASPDEVGITGTDWVLGLDGMFNLNVLKLYIPLYIAHLKYPSIPLDGEYSIGRISFVQLTSYPIRFSGPGFEFMLVPGTGDDAVRLELNGMAEGFTQTVTGLVSIAGGQVDIAALPVFPTIDPYADIPLSTLSFNLRTEITSSLRVQNGSSMNVVFEQGALDLVGTLSRPALTGKIIAPDGWLDILGNHFVLIEPLEFTFTSLYSITDPRIKATAQATLREVRSPGLFGEQLVVTARIDSRMKSILEGLHLTSEPPMSEESIIAALAYEDVVFRTVSSTLFGTGTISPGFDDVDLTGMGLSVATSYLSRHIRRSAGFTDFAFSLDERQNVLIYLEKEVFKNVVMYYQQRFGPDEEDEYLFGARYRWRPRSWVGFEYDSEEEITPRVEYIIPLN